MSPSRPVKIAVSSTGEFINAYSMETALTPADNKVTFENGGTAHLCCDGVLALDKMTPGDKVSPSKSLRRTNPTSRSSIGWSSKSAERSKMALSSLPEPKRSLV
jgi:hypothetical protein